jgi:hypothetical protein
LDSPPCWRVPSFKIPNLHSILKKKNPKYVWVIEYWNLRFICNLVLGIWDLGIRISKQAEGRDSYLWERLSSRDITAFTISTIYRLPLTTDYWILLGPGNGGESHYVSSQRR